MEVWSHNLQAVVAPMAVGRQAVVYSGIVNV